MLNRAFLYALFVLLVVAFSAKKVYDRDLGFHLRAGEWILENSSFPGTAVFSYGVPEREQINLYWLFEIVNSILFQLGGYVGLGVLQTILVLIIFWLVRGRLRIRGLSDSQILWTGLAILLVLELRINYRPEVWSLFFLAAMLFLMEKALRTRRLRDLWSVPFVMLIWVNSHALFILGLVVLSAYGLTMWRQRQWTRAHSVPFAVSFLATLVNPWHLEGAWYPFHLLFHFSSDSVFANAVSELSSPWNWGVAIQLGMPVEALALYGLFVAGGLIVLIVRFRSIEPHEFILFAVFAYVSGVQVRNVALFAVAVFPIVAHHLSGWSVRTNMIARVAPIGLTVILLSVTARIVTGAYYASDDRDVQPGYGLAVAQETENAVESRLRNQRILNSPNCGNWLSWRLRQPVWINTHFEMMGEEIYHEYRQSAGLGGLKRLIVRYRPQWVIVDHHSDLPWVLDLAADSLWSLIAYDSRTACFASDSKALSSSADLRHDWATLRLQPPSRWTYWLEGFYSHQSTRAGDLSLGQCALALGRYGEAEAAFLRYLRKTSATRPSVFKDLGLLYYFVQDNRKSSYCLARYLDSYPNDIDAKRILQLVMRKDNAPS